MSVWRRRLVAAAVVGAALGTAATMTRPREARAGAADLSLADALFRDGKALEAKGNHVAACPKFEESYRLDPKVGTLLNMAACHEAIGKTGTAWGEFNQAQADAHAQKRSDREAFAKAHAAALEAKLSKVTFVAAAADADATADLKLSLDGKELGSAPLGTPLPLDPGKHEVVAHADGREPYTTQVVVPPGPATQTVTIPPLEKAAAPVVAIAPPPPTATGVSTPAAASAEPSSSAPWRTPATIGSFALGGVGLVVAGVFGGLALGRHEDASKECVGTTCSADGVSKQDSARSLALGSTIAAVVGGVGVAAGIVLLLTKPRSDAPTSSGGTMWLRPSVGVGNGTAEWGVTF